MYQTLTLCHFFLHWFSTLHHLPQLLLQLENKCLFQICLIIWQYYCYYLHSPSHLWTCSAFWPSGQLDQQHPVAPVCLIFTILKEQCFAVLKENEYCFVSDETVQFCAVCAHWKLRFLFLADRSGAQCALRLLHTICLKVWCVVCYEMLFCSSWS